MAQQRFCSTQTSQCRVGVRVVVVVRVVVRVVVVVVVRVRVRVGQAIDRFLNRDDRHDTASRIPLRPKGTR